MGVFQTAQVLCSGPTLAEAISALSGSGLDTLFLGVNRAVEAIECQYWVAIDWKTIDEGRPLGSPRIITIETARQKLAGPVAKAYRTKGKRDDMPPEKMGWLNYSALLAITAAYDLGCKRIEVYGADMAGVDDWDGKQVGRVCRTDQRWAKERKQFDSLCEWMQGRGVKVTRI